MTFIRNAVEWAGVAIRMADGTLYAFELDYVETGEVSIEIEEVDNWPLSMELGYRVREPGRRTVDIHLRGEATHSQRFADMSPEQRKRLDPAVKEIESGRSL